MRASRLALLLALLPVAAAAQGAPERSSVRLADGRSLSYLHWPDAGRPKVLLLHGKGGFASSFEALATHWRGRFDLYAIDMAGRGFSDWQRNGDYSTEAALADVDAFTALAGLDRVALYGSSYGAVVALAWAAAHGERVPFLILDDGGPTTLPNGRLAPLNPGQAAVAGAPAPKPVPLHFAGWTEAQAWQAKSCRFQCTPMQLESRFVRTPAGVVERSDVVGLWATRRGAAFDDQWPAVRRLRVPTLVLRAERGLLPAEITRAMTAINARVRVVDVPGAVHTVGASKPDDAFRAADAFVASVE